MARDNILLCRRAVPKKVTLPNGRTFYAKYYRFSRGNLPRNITVRGNRTIDLQRRRKQRGGGMIRKLLKTGMKYWSKFLNSAIGKKIAEEGIKNVPNIYNAGVKRVSNQKIRRALESDLANYPVKRAQGEIYNWQNT